MKHILGILCLIWVIGVLPAAAQDEPQCLEYEGYHELYQVNLDTGEIASYELPDSSALPDSQNDYFTADLEQRTSLPTGMTLSLSDNRAGLTIVLAPVVTSYQIYWSPDRHWLAYVESAMAEEVETQALKLFNAETGAIISTSLGERWNAGYVELNWSPQSDFITVGLLVDVQGDNPSPETWVYSVPDLARLMTYTFAEAHGPPFVRWSPSENHFGVDLRDGTVRLVDTTSWEIYTSEVEDLTIPHQYFWSPDETYLIVESYYQTTAYESLNVMNMQGESVLGTMTINSFGRALRWLNDHQILLAVDEWHEAAENSYDFDYDITLFDFQTGEHHLILDQPAGYMLSQDQRYMASKSIEDDRVIRLFDLAQTDTFLIENITVEGSIYRYLWRNDRLELLVWFTNLSLHAYDLETHIWRTIADIPYHGDNYELHQVSCSE